MPEGTDFSLNTYFFPRGIAVRDNFIPKGKKEK